MSYKTKDGLIYPKSKTYYYNDEYRAKYVSIDADWSESAIEYTLYRFEEKIKVDECDEGSLHNEILKYIMNESVKSKS